MKPDDYGNIEVAALSDHELVAATSRWRTRASSGNADACRVAREHEDEMNRRFGGATTMPAPFAGGLHSADKPWWKRW